MLVGAEIDAACGQSLLGLGRRELGHVVVNHVIEVSTLGEVAHGVVDHLVGTERFHRVQMAGTAYTGAFCGLRICLGVRQ